ncbi:hypothetical protein J3A78_003874 [Streptomyces sp. PvR006]|uniref:hypothetical protein n=1 Tax=Streptomyces sp. PvR006 TaxID=2817860 RepID=UPI001AEADFDF|nr:hypothetical protein [Streptomyces sp. PvR006]MBP2583396.1 hypothetical protein [Streptomyces sp. PvR006]
MATSAVPAAIDALLEILRAAPALAEVQIVDGPPVDDQAVPDQLCIGWQPGDSESATMLQEFAYAGARSRNEEGVITCWIDCWSGDIDIRPRRLRAFEVLAVVEDALRASDTAREAPTLNGTVQWSQLAAGSLRQVSSDQGARAALGFTVTYLARL